MTSASAYFDLAVSTNARPLDEWMSGQLEWLKRHCPWLTANRITAARLILLPPFFAMLYAGIPAILPALAVICIVDGWCDVADGAWARKYGESSRWGVYFDQMSDKVSNWTRLWLIAWIINPAMHLNGVKISGYPLFWCLMALACAFDAKNLAERTYFYRRTEPSQNGAPAWIGKTKVWFQAYGISLLIFCHVSRMCAASDERIIAIMGLAISCLGACLFIPPRKFRRWWKDWQWFAKVGGNIALTLTAAHPDAREWTQKCAEMALCVSVVLAAMSAAVQSLRRLGVLAA